MGRVDIAARRWSIASRRSRRSSVERQRDAEVGEKKNKMNTSRLGVEKTSWIKSLD